MAAKRKPVKKAARKTGAKRAARPQVKGKTIATGTVRAAAKRRPTVAKAKVVKAPASMANAAKAKPVATVKPKPKARGGATQSPAQTSRPVERRSPVAEARPSAVLVEETPSADSAAIQPTPSAAVSTTPAEENGTPGLPVPIASFTI